MVLHRAAPRGGLRNRRPLIPWIESYQLQKRFASRSSYIAALDTQRVGSTSPRHPAVTITCSLSDAFAGSQHATEVRGRHRAASRKSRFAAMHRVAQSNDE